MAKTKRFGKNFEMMNGNHIGMTTEELTGEKDRNIMTKGYCDLGAVDEDTDISGQ